MIVHILHIIGYHAHLPCKAYATEDRLIKVFESITDHEDKFTHILVKDINDEVRFIKVFEPVNNFDACLIGVPLF